MKAIIDKKVKHQNIGGEEIDIEEEMIVGDIFDTNFNHMTIAMYNLIARRPDVFLYANEKDVENMKVYYGHVGILGYFVLEDEIEEMK